MTASIQTKNNKYYIVLNWRSVPNKREQKWIKTDLTVTGNNKRKVEELRLQVLNEWKNKIETGSDIKFSEYLKSWLDEKRESVEATTYHGYTSNMNNHIIPYFEKLGIRLCDVKAKTLNEYYLTKIKDGLSPTTVKHHHQNISSALSEAVVKELLQINPATTAKVPKSEQFRGNFLNINQLNEMLELFRNTDIWIPIALATFYGLRRSEILGLCWNNVDFANKKIVIAQTTVQIIGGDVLRNKTKNSSSYRALPLNGDMFEILLREKYRQDYGKETFPYWQDNDFVCVDDKGYPIKANHLTTAFSKKIKSSNLPYVRLHDLRHSTASNLLSMNHSVVEVQEWMGHSSPNTTLAYYSHIHPSESKKRIGIELSDKLTLTKPQQTE